MATDDLLKEDILSLGMRADDARRSADPFARVSYQRVHVVTPEQVRAGFEVPVAASEVRMAGSATGLDDAVALVRKVQAVAGGRPIRALSAVDLGEWGNLDDVARALKDAGLTDVAELPADLLPDLARFVSRARAAGLRADRITIANALGARAPGVLEIIARCVRELNGIERVAPLPTQMAVEKPTTGYEDVRSVALARLALHDLRPPVFIAVDWRLYGPKLAQVALMFGADFLDNVPATDNELLGTRRATVADVERNIRAAGFEPRAWPRA